MKAIPITALVVLVSAVATGCGDPAPPASRDGEPTAYAESDAARAARMVVMSRPDEAVALLEPHLAAHQDDASAHFALGAALRQQAFELSLKQTATDQSVSAARTTLLARAADEYESGLMLVRHRQTKDAKAAALMALVEIHGASGLGRLADAERAARQLVDQNPELEDSHRLLAIALGEQGRHVEAVDVFRRARSALPASQERNLAISMWYYLEVTPNVPTTAVATLVGEMTDIADAWLARAPGEPTGPIVKHHALKMQAEHLEHDAGRRRQILAAARAWEQVAEMHLHEETADLVARINELKALQAQARPTSTR